jgi:tetratricopeptide (TPR) repeat protein
VYRGDLEAAGRAARAAHDAAQGLAPVVSRRPLEALGEVAVFRGELADAADLYARAYELSIGNGDARDAAWDAASALGHYDRAIREWQEAGAWTPLWVTLRTLVEFLCASAPGATRPLSTVR